MKVPHGHVPPPYEPDAAERLFKIWKDFIASQHYPHGTDAYLGDEAVAACRALFSSPSKMLFLGCGDGTEVHRAIQEFGHDAYGVTLNSNNLQFARETLGLTHVYLMDAHLLPREWEDRFDAVMGFQFLEHSPAPVLLLVEALRVLKSGGLVYFETPGADRHTGGENLHHILCYTKVQAEGLLLKAGFVDVRVNEIGPSDAARHVAFFGRKPNG